MHLMTNNFILERTKKEVEANTNPTAVAKLGVLKKEKYLEISVHEPRMTKILQYAQ